MSPLLRASVGLHVLAGGALALAPGSAGWVVAALVANHAGLTIAGLLPRSSVLGPNLVRLPEQSMARHEIAITIDDGPDPEVTPAVLDVLEAEKLKATFFCIADNARAHPGLTRDIVRRGHSVQNHSAGHHHHFSLLGPRGFHEELSRAQGTLADITGVAPTCFRAPAGLRNPFLDPVLHRLGLHLVSWTRRGYDTRAGDAALVLTRLTRSLGAGDILLLHDGHAARTPEGRPVLLEVIPLLAGRLRDAGLRAVTLPDAIVPRISTRPS